MNNLCPIKHSNITASKTTGLVYQTRGHQFMSFQEVFRAIRVKSQNLIICSVGIFYSFNVVLFAGNQFAIDNIRHFINRERIVLDCKRRINCPNTILPVQLDITTETGAIFKLSDSLSYFGQIVGGCQRYCIWRCVHSENSFPTISLNLVSSSFENVSPLPIL
jgi:hypothetical protein